MKIVRLVSVSDSWVHARMTPKHARAMRANAESLGLSTADLARAAARFDVTTDSALRGEADVALTAFDPLGISRVKVQFSRWTNHRVQYFRAIDALVHKHFTNVAHAERVATSAYDKLLYLDALAGVGIKACEEIDAERVRAFSAFGKGRPTPFAFRADEETAASLARNCALLGVSKSDYVRGFCVPGIDDEWELGRYFAARRVYVDCDSLPELVELVRSTGYLFDDALHDMNVIRAAESMNYYRAVELCQQADEKLGRASARWERIWESLDGYRCSLDDGFVAIPVRND